MRQAAASAIKEWMDGLARAACGAGSIETSAGAGPGREYAYLHFRRPDGTHSALVLRAVTVDGRSEVWAYELDAGPDEIRDAVDRATHGAPPPPA